MKHIYLLITAMFICTTQQTFSATPLVCNGYEALCSRRLNEVTLLGAHNIGYRKSRTQNQKYSLRQLLNMGVRYAKVRVNRVPAFLYKGAPSFTYDRKKYVAVACHSLTRRTLYEEAGIKDLLRSIPTEELRTKIDDEIESLEKKVKSLEKELDQAKQLKGKIKQTKELKQRIKLRAKNFKTKLVLRAKLLRTKTKLARKKVMRKIKSPFLSIAETKGERLTNVEMKLFKKTVGTDQHPGPFPFNPCLADPSAKPLIDVLRVIKEFLVTHPHDIFILNVEDYVFDLAILSDLFIKAGLSKLMYIHKAGAPWPTLGEMIKKNKRLFVVIQNWSEALQWGNYPWNSYPALHNKDDQIQDTKYEFHSVKDLLSYDQDRKPHPNILLLMQHFVTKKIGGEREAATKVNTYEAIMKRAHAIMQETGRKPNIIDLDFVGVPSIDEQLRAIRNLNGLAEFADKPIMPKP